MGVTKAPRRRIAIFIVKLVHTAWFALVSTSILHLFVAGVRNRTSRWTALALGSALLESAVFLANRGHCPLTGLAEDLGAESGRVSDIFLPRWFADRIPQIYTPPLVIGLVLLLWNRRHLHAAPPRQVAEEPPVRLPPSTWVLAVQHGTIRVDPWPEVLHHGTHPTPSEQAR